MRNFAAARNHELNTGVGGAHHFVRIANSVNEIEAQLLFKGEFEITVEDVTKHFHDNNTKCLLVPSPDSKARPWKQRLCSKPRSSCSRMHVGPSTMTHSRPGNFN